MAVERESEWEVGPTKDVIQAFIETLVDPKFPYGCSIENPPSEDDHKAIARQMHAVVLLYNYYHRKQKPELDFLDFVPFCKLALSIRSKFKPFMRTIDGSEAADFSGCESVLSLTERTVKSACDIAKSLDASTDVPITEGYPISTVAVLLIDSKKENCSLQYNGVTLGVWSLIEKEVDELGEGQDIVGDERACKKRKTNEQQPLSDHSKFLQIGFDAVKDVAGIEVSDLEVLEADVVYTLSKEKSASQFYIMRWNKSFDPKKMFALDSLVESLSGPLANNCDGSWVSSDLVEYHRLLPYSELISNWLPRKASSTPILVDCVTQIIKKKEVRKTPPSKIPTTPLAEYSIGDLDYINNRSATRRITRSHQKAAASYGDSKLPQKKGNNASARKVASPVREKSPLKLSEDDASPRIENLEDLLNITFLSTEREETNSKKKTIPSPKTPFSSSVVNKKNDSNKRSFNQIKSISSAQNDAEDDVGLKDDDADLQKSNDDRCSDERSTKENGDAAAEVDLRNALALLERKRREMYFRLCDKEDMLALYELVIARVRDGEEVDLARRSIKHILNGNDRLLLQNESEAHSHSTTQAQEQTTFPDIYLPGRSSIQDLQYICEKNNWWLPKYYVQPSSNGKLVSSVISQCEGATVSAKGSEEESPLKARESAAAQMIAKIQAHYSTATHQK